MESKISAHTKKELVEALKVQYRKSSKMEKTQILNQFIKVSGYHRKHAIRLLTTGKNSDHNDSSKIIKSRRIYNEAVKEALIILWEAADRICGKRLKAILPSLIDSMQRHGHLNLDAEVKKQLLKVSAATIDRLLFPIRDRSQSRRKKRRIKKVGNQIPVRTFNDWNDPNPGYLEIDFVVHGGGLISGSLIYTLVSTDISSGWTEFIPLLAREQSLVVEGLKAIFQQIPFPVLGIDSDNDSAFINETLLAFSREYNIEFTRSRAYHKNDQAWIEQKNGAIIRKMVGHDRFSGVIACKALANLYKATRLYVNYFQPSFKLREKTRDGSKYKRTYEPPSTACDKLLKHPLVNDQIKENLRSQRQQLDPIKLLHNIRQSQSTLSAIASADCSKQSPQRDSLEQFLSQLPQLWREGEVRPTHQGKTSKPRHWRSRKDPYEGVWYEVLDWLGQEPDITAKDLLKKLQHKYPRRFADGQLRTLQRRVKEWRKIMARELIYGCTEQ
ncbi:MAG TPA: transposase [Phycisphaerales bacterium]|nr:transposase [Phycisphaerales bacterium]